MEWAPVGHALEHARQSQHADRIGLVNTLFPDTQYGLTLSYNIARWCCSWVRASSFEWGDTRQPETGQSPSSGCAPLRGYNEARVKGKHPRELRGPCLPLGH